LGGDITTAAMFWSHRTDSDARSHAKFMDKFKKDVIDQYEQVFYIMGNHEHYRSIFRKTLPELKEGFANHGMDKIEFFDNDSKVVDDVLFVGSTLWSDFENGDDLSIYNCGRNMNDFRVIGSMDVEDMNYFNRYKSRTITPEFILEEHKKSLEFLKTNVKLGNKVVVFTHHGPTYQSLHSEHIGDGMDGAYCSDLSEFILDNPQIKVWIHGHTHQSKDYMVGECRVLAKQQGYYMERSYSQFDGPGTVEI
jgi:Icc-related predicted phosphoesterase